MQKQKWTCRSTCQYSWHQRLDTSPLCLLWEQLGAYTAIVRGRSRPNCKVLLYSTPLDQYSFCTVTIHVGTFRVLLLEWKAALLFGCKALFQWVIALFILYKWTYIYDTEKCSELHSPKPVWLTMDVIKVVQDSCKWLWNFDRQHLARDMHDMLKAIYQLKVTYSSCGMTDLLALYTIVHHSMTVGIFLSQHQRFGWKKMVNTIRK